MKQIPIIKMDFSEKMWQAYLITYKNTGETKYLEHSSEQRLLFYLENDQTGTYQYFFDIWDTVYWRYVDENIASMTMNVEEIIITMHEDENNIIWVCVETPDYTAWCY